MPVRRCMNCNGTGKVWNEKTQKNDLKCSACGGTGKIIVQNVSN